MHFLLHLVTKFLMKTVGRSAADFLLKPFLGFIDGSDEPAEFRPLYSVAEARRKQGRYQEALDHVRGQLERFPTDYQGQMMLAEINALDLKDVAAAEVVIQKLVAQKSQSPGHIFDALTVLADWHLKYGRDRAAALRCFERIIELFPETELEMRAAQRIAHLPDAAMLAGSGRQRTLELSHDDRDIGLQVGPLTSPAEPDPADLAAGYVKRLEDFPLDWDAREQLAEIYAEKFQRLDLAESQLDQLIQYPNQPVTQVAKWLNRLADLQVKHGTYDAALAALQRVIDLNPTGSAANMAQNRIARLKLEFKGKEKSQAVMLGSYEDDLGLKGSAHKL